VLATAAPQYEPAAPAQGGGVPQPGPPAAGEREIPRARKACPREPAAPAAGAEHDPAREQKRAQPGSAQVASESGGVRAAALSPSAPVGVRGAGDGGWGRVAEPRPPGARGAGRAAVWLEARECPGLARIEPQWAGAGGAGGKPATGFGMGTKPKAGSRPRVGRDL